MGCEFCSAAVQGECPHSADKCAAMHQAMRDERRKIGERLTETQRNALAFLPAGHFTAATIRALQQRGLIQGTHRTVEGQRVLDAMKPED